MRHYGLSTIHSRARPPPNRRTEKDVGGHVDSGQGQHACVITLLQLLPQLLPPFAKPLHVRRLRGPSPASLQVKGPIRWRRMGDSNPRGLAPNTLSNCVFRCSRQSGNVYLCRSTRVRRQRPTVIDVGEHGGTATDTATGRARVAPEVPMPRRSTRRRCLRGALRLVYGSDGARGACPGRAGAR